jgi:serine phosphatase RsbU (regulator of sigma subunit)
MKVNGRSPILVCASQAGALAELCQVLRRAGHDVGEYLLGASDPEDLRRYRLLVVDGSWDEGKSLALCRRLRQRLNEAFIPILFITGNHGPEARLASFEAGADTYLLRPFVTGELLAQAQAFLRIKNLHDSLADRTAEVHRINKRLQQAYQQIDQELELAQRIQASFLPQSLPRLPHGRFAVHYLLRGRVGGDFYDVFRLDEKHVGFYVADAMGHGVPASLLTIFVKMGVRAKEVAGQQYRLVPPDEVLLRLNREMIEQELSECPFITMIYGLFNHEEGILHFARAGHPYPLYLPREGDVELWQQDGLLLGVVEARFPVQSHHLQPGDKVLFYSDGIDSARFADHEPGTPSLLACAVRHRALPVQEFVDRLARDLFDGSAQPDDLTLLALELSDSGPGI